MLSRGTANLEFQMCANFDVMMLSIGFNCQLAKSTCGDILVKENHFAMNVLYQN